VLPPGSLRCFHERKSKGACLRPEAKTVFNERKKIDFARWLVAKMLLVGCTHCSPVTISRRLSEAKSPQPKYPEPGVKFCPVTVKHFPHVLKSSS